MLLLGLLGWNVVVKKKWEKCLDVVKKKWEKVDIPKISHLESVLGDGMKQLP